MSIIWQYLDKKSATVNALKDYSSMKYIIEHTDDDIATIRSDLASVGSPTFTDMPSGQHNPQSGEIRLVNAIDEIDVLRERYRQAKEYMEWFQPAWDSLSEDEQFVLTCFYWCDTQHDAIDDICDKFHIERSSAYNKKNRALQHLTTLLYGKA